MSTDLLSQIRERESSAREKALRQYPELLARAGNPREGDADALAKMMSILGITADQFSDDLGAFNRAKSAQAQVVSEAEIAKLSTASVEAARAYNEAEAAWFQREVELKAAVNAEGTKLAMAQKRSELAQKTIDSCRQSNPRAFGFTESPAQVVQQQSPGGYTLTGDGSELHKATDTAPKDYSPKTSAGPMPNVLTGSGV